jgi:hypothetical protein
LEAKAPLSLLYKEALVSIPILPMWDKPHIYTNNLKKIGPMDTYFWIFSSGKREKIYGYII